MTNKMQPAECAKILSEMLEYLRLTVKEKQALRAASEIVRNHVDIVRCGECIYHHEIPCPVDIDMDTPTPDDWYCPCGAKMGEHNV